jgi:hypothetical protein
LYLPGVPDEPSAPGNGSALTPVILTKGKDPPAKPLLTTRSPRLETGAWHV